MESNSEAQPPGSGLSRRSFLAAGSIGVLGVGLGLSGCSTGGTKTSNGNAKTSQFTGGPAKGGTPVKGGTLRVGIVTGGTSETLSILTSFAQPDILRIYSLYDPMFVPGPAGSVLPGLIEEAVPNATATVWTFHVRRGVVFHNGKPLTADDIVYTIQHSWGSGNNAYNAVLSTIVDFAGVRKLDNYTVQVPLKLGIAQFPSVTVIQNCYVVQNGTTNFSDGIGTGPFKLQSFVPGKRSVFVANKNYWRQGQPYVDKLIIDSSYSNDQTRLNALLAGDLDIVPGVIPSLAAANAASGRIVLGNQPGPSFVGISFRVDQGPFTDPQVRKALKLIPDRQQFVTTALSGYGVVTNDVPGYTDQYWASDLKIRQDLGQARSLLKAAGRDGLTFTLPTSNVAPGQTEIATLFQQQAKRAGVTVNIKQIPAATYYTSAAGFFTRNISTEYYASGVNSLAAFYVTSMVAGGPYNDTHWGGTTSFGPRNGLLFDALRETDTAKATDKWHAVQKIMLETGPYIIPGTSNWLDAYSTKVRGVETTSVYNCDNLNFAGAWLAR